MYPRTAPPPPLQLFRIRTFATFYAEGRIKPTRFVGRSLRFSVKDIDNFGRKKGDNRQIWQHTWGRPRISIQLILEIDVGLWEDDGLFLMPVLRCKPKRITAPSHAHEY